MVRLRRAAVLLVIVYMTHGLAESCDNLVNMWELVNPFRSNDWQFMCIGDWNMALGEMGKTEMKRSIDAVIKTPGGVEESTIGESLIRSKQPIQHVLLWLHEDAELGEAGEKS